MRKNPVFAIFLLLLFSFPSISHANLVATPRIIGGGEVGTTVPWMVGLHNYLPETDQYSVYPFCGGSLIAPRWVITAAHCITEPRTGDSPELYRKNPANMVMRVGDNNLDNVPRESAGNVFVHPRYGFGTNSSPDADNDFNNDIALIRLSAAVSREPLDLPDEDLMYVLERASQLDDIVEVMGWGITDSAGFDPDLLGSLEPAEIEVFLPGMLQSVLLDYLPRSSSVCRFSFANMTNQMICAWEPEPDPEDAFGEDTCNGDSGGPLLLRDGTELDGPVSGNWLLGVTSFGVEGCSELQAPSVYSRVANYVQWIEETTATAGNPIVDMGLYLEIPEVANPDQFSLIVEVENNSTVNVSDSLVLVEPGGSLIRGVDLVGGDANCGRRLNCNLRNPIAAGESELLLIDARWTGALDTPVDVTLALREIVPHDYRAANNQATSSVIFTRKPDLVMQPWRTLGLDGGSARLAVDVANDSLVNPALATELMITLPAGLAVDAIDARCIENPSGSGLWQCTLGDLATGAVEAVELTVSGTGTFVLIAEASNSNGDLTVGDTRAETEIEVSLLPDPQLQSWQQTGVAAEGVSLLINAMNASLWNSAEATELTITMPAGLSVVSIDSRCSDQEGGVWLCDLNTLAPEADSSVALTVSGTGTFLIEAALVAGNGDIAPGDSSEQISVTYTELPDPFINAWEILGQEHDQAALSVSFGNASGWHSATEAMVNLSFSEDLAVTNIDARCLHLVGGRWQCSLGSIGPGAQGTIALAVQGIGSFTVEASFNSSNGDDQPGDLVAATALMLTAAPVEEGAGGKSSSGGGTAFWWWLPALWFGRRRVMGV